MKNCITCLPLTLQSEIKTGFVLTPFVVSMLSKLTGLNSVCCVNLTGMRYKDISKNEIKSRLGNFQVLLNRLGVAPSHYWIDSDPSHIARLGQYCESLAESGKLRCVRKNVLICQCGAVEILAEAVATEWIGEGKVIEKRAGQVFCKLCKTTLNSTDPQCLLLESSLGKVTIQTHPSFYGKEINELQKFNQPILVSRQRTSDYSIPLFGQKWQLDTDFCWSLLFCSLIEDGFQPDVVVVSNHVLKQLVWSLGISRNLSDKIDTVTAIVMPYVSFGESESRLSQTKQVSQLLDRYGQLLVRLLLASALKWDQKEICVSSKQIFWALKGLSNMLATPLTITGSTMTSIQCAFESMDGNFVDRLISDLRKSSGKPLSQYHKLLLGKVL